MARRIPLIGLLVLLAAAPDGRAIPQSFFGNGFFGPVIPATPRFRADMTGDVLDVSNWVRGELPGPWEEPSSFDARSTRRMQAVPVLFGAVPGSVETRSAEGELREIAITYLDAGSFFGYRAASGASHRKREEGEKRRAEFDRHYKQLKQNLRQRLEAGCGAGTARVLGRSEILRGAVIDYRCEDFVIRMAARPGSSIQLCIYRHGDVPEGYLRAEVAGADAEGREEMLRAFVQDSEYDDGVRLSGVPAFRQGSTPYCGIGSLAMTADHLGLHVSPQALQAAAAFRNTGSARGSRIMDLYRGVAEELGMRLGMSSKFDPRRVRKSLEAGVPVIVWRRVSEEREKAHAAHARRLADDPAARLAEPSREDRRAWPPRERKSLPSHGSVITGLAADGSEVIYAEPWGPETHGRRMRVEEMQATTYAAFYYRF